MSCTSSDTRNNPYIGTAERFLEPHKKINYEKFGVVENSS